MLLGIAFIYSQSGSLKFESLNLNSGYEMFYQAGMLLFLVGVAFKLSLAPFHFWTPDVYQGAPLPITLLLATVSKISIFIVLMKCWFSQAYLMTVQAHNETMYSLISLLAITSMLVGNSLALRQENIKRILAYSSIAHMGYLLIVLLIISPKSTTLAWQSALFYLSAYILATISIFTALMLTQDKKEDSAAKIKDWQGLFWQRRSLALLIIIAVLSLAGIPLTAGFIGKFYLLNIAVQAQQWWLIGALIIGSGIALFYYLNMIFVLFHLEPKLNENRDGKSSAFVEVSMVSQVAIYCLVLLGLYWGVFPDTLSQLFAAQ